LFKSIEFLRTFSALGVVWIHTWILYQNPSLSLGKIDVFKIISFVGNGVDFFFVISGFLMYLALQRKEFSLNTYANFIKKRFLRIAPLYYISILVYFLVYKFLQNQDIPFKDVVIDALFLNNYFDVNIAYTFWSLAVEWLFYLIIPFLFIFRSRKMQSYTFLLICLISIVRLFQVEASSKLFLTPDIPLPLFIEFGWGILIGMIITNDAWKLKFQVKQSWLNLLIGFGILYFGRVMRLTELVENAGSYAGSYAIFLKVLSGPVMTFGFAYIMWMLIGSIGKFNGFVEHRFFQFIGRLSFGIYIWHVLILSIIPWNQLSTYMPVPIAMILTFLMVSTLTTFLSWLTYELVEKNYFKSSLSSKHIS
jgi:peptidoglycan/LPS O-acetylase OafA/YrhL